MVVTFNELNQIDLSARRMDGGFEIVIKTKGDQLILSPQEARKVIALLKSIVRDVEHYDGSKN